MSLTIERANVLPDLDSSVRDQFIDALTRRCAEVLGLTGFLVNLGGRDLVIDSLDLRISATAHQVTQDPKRYGAHAGAGLAARIISKNQKSAAAPAGAPPKTAVMVDCLKCKHRVRLTATCMYCGAALAAPPAAGAAVNRQQLVDAAFRAAGWISDVGLGVREIDKQYAQDILEGLGLASKISILDLGTAVRAPRSDLDYALAVDGQTDVQFVRVHQAMTQVGFEANAGGLANRFLDLDDLLRQAKAGVLSGNLVTKLLKAEQLAGAPAQRAKVEAIKLAVISNPKYLEWLRNEVKGRPITGPVMGPAFHLKDTAGGIRDLQHLSWLSAFLSRTPHDAFERFDGLVKGGPHHRRGVADPPEGPDALPRAAARAARRRRQGARLLRGRAGDRRGQPARDPPRPAPGHGAALPRRVAPAPGEDPGEALAPHDRPPAPARPRLPPGRGTRCGSPPPPGSTARTSCRASSSSATPRG